MTVNFFPSKAKLVDGSIQNIERDTIVKWEVKFTEIHPEVLQNMGEKAVKKWVEKLGRMLFGVQSKKYRCCGLMIGNESM